MWAYLNFFILLSITYDVLPCAGQGTPMVRRKVNDNKGESTYIVGGTNANPGEFPWQVSILLLNNHNCGGSILNNQWILTAAHCLKLSSNPSDYTVLAGTNKLNSGGVRINVIKIIKHPDYKFMNNDIGLVKLGSSLTWSNTIQPVSLSSTDPTPNTTATIIGWGFVNQRGTARTNTLQKIDVLTISNSDCHNRTQLSIPAGDFCTFTQKGEGTCQGDSGGPVVDSSTLEQIGIVSANYPCAIGKPDIHTRINSYTSWINSYQM